MLSTPPKRPTNRSAVSTIGRQGILPRARQLEILKEQVDLLNEHAIAALVVHVVLAGILGYLEWRPQTAPPLTIWLCALAGIIAVRAFVVIAYRHSNNRLDSAPSWSFWFVAGSVAAGLAWGAGGVLLIKYAEVSRYPAIVFIIVGMCAGGITTHGAIPAGYLGFTLPAIAPVSVLLMFESDTERQILGLLAGVLIVILLTIYFRYYRILMNGIFTKFSMQDMQQRLDNAAHDLDIAEQRSRSITDHLAHGLIVVDHQAAIIQMNPEAERMLGWPQTEIIGRDFHKLIHRKSESLLFPEHECLVSRVMSQDGAYRSEDGYFQCKDGTNIPVSLIAAARRLPNEAASIVISFQDISERKQAEQALRDSQKTFQDIAMSSADWIWETGENGQFTYASGRVEDLLGYTPEELLGKTPYDLVDEAEAERVGKIMEKIMTRKARIVDLETKTRTKTGETVYLLTSGMPILDDQKRLRGYRGLAKDITERKKMEQELAESAIRDPLTGLFNRREFTRLLKAELLRAFRYSRPLSLFMMDIDHFKSINDTYGHAVGDRVIVWLADTIRASIRNSDFAGRYGGEEFIIVLPETTPAKAMVMAERFRANVASHPVVTESARSITISISGGMAGFPDHGSTMETLLRIADDALYVAKSGGRNRVCMAGDTEPKSSQQASV